jgi:hypothetical protein
MAAVALEPLRQLPSRAAGPAPGSAAPPAAGGARPATKPAPGQPRAGPAIDLTQDSDDNDDGGTARAGRQGEVLGAAGLAPGGEPWQRGPAEHAQQGDAAEEGHRDDEQEEEEEEEEEFVELTSLEATQEGQPSPAPGRPRSRQPSYGSGPPRARPPSGGSGAPPLGAPRGALGGQAAAGVGGNPFAVTARSQPAPQQPTAGAAPWAAGRHGGLPLGSRPADGRVAAGAPAEGAAARPPSAAAARADVLETLRAVE